MVIKVSRVNDAGTTTVTTDIPFKTDKTVDPNMFKDQQTVTQAGVVGKLETSFKVVTVDGREVSRTQTGQQVTTAAVDQKITVGGKDRPAAPAAGANTGAAAPAAMNAGHVGQDRAVRVRRELAHQHRQRLLRRTAVRQRHLAGQRRRRLRPARRPGQPRAADRRRQHVLRQGRALAVGLRLRRLPVETLRLHYDGRVTEPDSDPQTGRPDVRRGSGVQPLLGASDIRRLAEEIGVRPTKTLGQNFVIDGNTIRRIVAAAHLAPQETVLEVGPGLGSLTLGLLDAAARVVAVEIDPVLAAKLPHTVAAFRPELAGNLDVVLSDAMRVTELPTRPTALVANLPYNVAVPVVLHLLQHFPSLQHGLVMVQDEVADRLAAGPGSKTYGVPSVKAAWYSQMRKAGVIGMNVFWPAPKISSGLVSFTRREPPGHARQQGPGVRRHRRRLRPAPQDPAGSARRLGRRGRGGRALPARGRRRSQRTRRGHRRGRLRPDRRGRDSPARLSLRSTAPRQLAAG